MTNRKRSILTGQSSSERNNSSSDNNCGRRNKSQNEDGCVVMPCTIKNAEKGLNTTTTATHTDDQLGKLLNDDLDDDVPKTSLSDFEDDEEYGMEEDGDGGFDFDFDRNERKRYVNKKNSKTNSSSLIDEEELGDDVDEEGDIAIDLSDLGEGEDDIECEDLNSGDEEGDLVSSKDPQSLSEGNEGVSSKEVKSFWFESCFYNRRPVLYFPKEGETLAPIPKKYQKSMKWKTTTLTPRVIKQLLRRAGFKLIKSGQEWLGSWGKQLHSTVYRKIKPTQKLNHYPKSAEVGRKDRLSKNIQSMQIKFSKGEFNFLPQTFCMPEDSSRLQRVMEQRKGNSLWIVKPAASARGIGIKVIKKWAQVPKKKHVVVQRYVSNPYLIDGLKFDMRLYVYVSSLDPLRIYLYDDGLARFATTKYTKSKKKISSRYMHLTNYSLNKKSKNFIKNTDADLDNTGSKWSLKALKTYLRKEGVDVDGLWAKIEDLIVKTILSADSTLYTTMKLNVKSDKSCHELFGVDVMLDDSLKPWLMEFNISPSLQSASPLDKKIKAGVVRDVFNLAGFVPLNPSDKTKLMRDEPMRLSAVERASHLSCLNSNTFPLMSEYDIDLIATSEEELARAGNFKRIFPGPETMKYEVYFENKRYNNFILQKWASLNLPTAILIAQINSMLLKYNRVQTTSTSKTSASSCSSASSKDKKSKSPEDLDIIKRHMGSLEDNFPSSLNTSGSSASPSPRNSASSAKEYINKHPLAQPRRQSIYANRSENSLQEGRKSVYIRKRDTTNALASSKNSLQSTFGHQTAPKHGGSMDITPPTTSARKNVTFPFPSAAEQNALNNLKNLGGLSNIKDRKAIIAKRHGEASRLLKGEVSGSEVNLSLNPELISLLGQDRQEFTHTFLKQVDSIAHRFSKHSLSGPEKKGPHGDTARKSSFATETIPNSRIDNTGDAPLYKWVNHY
eukprot:Nk52_evm19s311 gene=Nk52_evmTU19s311